MSSQELRRRGHLIRWQEIRDMEGPYEETEFQRISEAVDLPPEVTEMAQMIFEQCRENDLIHGRLTDRVIGACLHIACRQQRCGVTLSKISQVTSISENDLSNTSRDIARELPFRVQFALPEQYIDPFIDDINEYRKSREQEPLSPEVRERSHELMTLVQENHMISGKSPTGVASAGIYLAAQQYDEVLSQEQVSFVNDVGTTTIRNRYREIEEVWQNT